MRKRRYLTMKIAGGVLALFAAFSAQAATLCPIPSHATDSACPAAAFSDGDDTSQLLDCIDSLLDQKRHLDALGALTKGISVYSNTSQLLRNRGWTWFSKEDYNCASSDLTAAIEYNPYDEKNYHIKGIIYHFQRQHQDAIAVLNRAIELNPNFSNAYLSRAFAYNKLNELVLAQADVRRYLFEFPDCPMGKLTWRHINELLEYRQGLACAINHTSCG
jgi:tetratricopeptide (TPR) repeat protein